ncbi:MAG TPA: alpha/beta hydrolase [Acidobacteriota bacterium]|nr:alpha/beta hydrolase [Acidobacteriota bacterium]HQQ46322.1 alpha/beta hydrolase [Acidobacteriota bacterium]
MNRKNMKRKTAPSTNSLLFALLIASLVFICPIAQQHWPKIVVSSDGTPVSYQVYGDGEITLVFVHGWSCDSRYFREQVEPFSKKYRLILVDLAGHGHSGSGRAEYTMESFGEDVRAVVDAAGAKRVILVGHSMGGQVIAEAAALMPGRVLGLIGIDTLEDVGYRMEEKEFAEWMAPLEMDFVKGTGKFVAEMFSPDTDPPLKDWILRDMTSAQPAVALSAMTTMVRQYISGDAASVFDKVRVPVVSVNSDKWPVNLEGNRKRMFFYDAIVMKGADHFLMMARPSEFNANLEKAVGMILDNAPRLDSPTCLPPEANSMKPGFAPTPFSADQIRKALPKGSLVKLWNETPDGPPTVITFRFLGGTKQNARLETTITDVKGDTLGPPDKSAPSWRELQSHASYPENSTRIEQGKIRTFRGDLDCWLYEVREGGKVTRYWFAKELPGPPVLLEEIMNGKLERRLRMVGRE